MYAPVIIPTLNRINHLKRCLNSLNENSLANKTEIYISVDFPTDSKYIEGYHEVVKFLKNMPNYNFKNINIYFQEKNLGPFRNIDFLKEKISDKYDRYILTEDDNEFSKNFLSYINSTLKYFDDNPNVLAVCGFKDTNWIFEKNNNIAFSKLYSAYGIGIYMNKEKKVKDEATKFLLNPKNWSIKNLFSLFRKNRKLFNIFILDILLKDHGLFWMDSNKLNVCDTVYSIYMHLSDYCVVVPIKAKSRTWGNDGSGVNMPNRQIDVVRMYPLDNESKFSVCVNPNITFNKLNYKLGNKYLNTINSWKTTVKAIVYYFILLCYQCDRNKLLNKLEKRR